MKLRRLTPSGISQFAAYLANLKTDPTLDPPRHLLEERASSEPVADVEIEDKKFATRFDVAAYLDDKLSASDLTSPERDARMWAWLGLFYFDQLAPNRSSSPRKPGKDYRYIPEAGFQVRYRHLLRGPYLTYHAYAKTPELIRLLLANDLSKPGELYEQIASRQDLIANGGLMATLTQLYWDGAKQRLRRGAAGSGPGSARRVSPVLDQFDLTYDLFALDLKRFNDLLPGEFDRFRV